MWGVLRYRRENVVAILDSTRAGGTEDGVPIVPDVDDSLCFGPTRAIVGVATAGGRFPSAWRELVRACVRQGLDVESGLHEFLGDDPELVELAGRFGVELHDLRRPPSGLSVLDRGHLEHGGRVVLTTVGSDCAIGKMTVALELEREARARGLPSVFVPTGQTGMAIAGWGIAVDAVVADFIAGAAEHLVVEGSRRGELLLVEGQGSLVHPAYSGVTLGLVHGSAPHVYVLCHRAGSTEIDGHPGHPLPSLAALVQLHERISRPRGRPRLPALRSNTSGLGDAAAGAALAAAEDETGLPADDPVRNGAGRLLDSILARLP